MGAAFVVNTPDLKELVQAPPDFANDPRYKDLDRLEAYYRNRAYSHRPYDWDGTRPIIDPNDPAMASLLPPYRPEFAVPVAMRKPSVVYNMSRLVVDRFVSLLWGEHRFPTIRVSRDRDTEDYFASEVKRLNMRAIMMEAATLGGAEGSVLIALSVLNGRFRLENFNAKWITPLWRDFHAGVLKAYRIMYPFTKHVYNKEAKKYELQWWLYRRVVTEEWDVTFKPQRLVDDKNLVLTKEEQEKDPEPDLELSFEHGLGFVPAVFVQNVPRYDQIDGESTVEGAVELFDPINELLSAIDSALHGNLDPTLVLQITPEDWKKLQGRPNQPVVVGSAGGGLVVGKDGKAYYLEFTGEGIKVAMDYLKQLRDYALEVAQCVIADPHRITGNAQSAAAITKLYAHMLAKADILRNQYGEFALKRLLTMMLQIIKLKDGQYRVLDDGKVTQSRFEYPVQSDPDTGADKVLKPRLDVREDDIGLQWGEYFEPLVADVFQAVEAGYIARGNKAVATAETIIKWLAPFLGDQDPHHSLKALETEQIEADAREDHVIQLGGAVKKAGSGSGVSPKTAPVNTPTRDTD